MDKESSIKVARVLRDASAALTKVASERDAYAEENAMLKRHQECTKLASRMHTKGLELDTPYEVLVAHLEKEAQAGKLGEITRAVDMSGANMSFAKTASNHDGTGVSGESSLTGYLLGHIE